MPFLQMRKQAQSGEVTARGQTAHKLLEFGKQTYCPNSKCIPQAQEGAGGADLFDIRARGTQGSMHLMRFRHTYTHSQVPLALTEEKRRPELSQCFGGESLLRAVPEFGGFLGPQPPGAPLLPQDSQIDTVIGRRWDIPRETHLHAWVTPPLLPAS